MIEHRLCACMSVVSADPADPGPGVRPHNATPEHRAWRRRRMRVETTRLWQRQLRAELERVRLERWAARVAVGEAD